MLTFVMSKLEIMARNDTRVTDNPKLKQKKLSDGNYSLYLEYYLGYNMVYSEKQDKQVVKAKRRKEFLGLTLLAKPRTPIERETNRQTIELAQRIRFEREQQFKERGLGYRVKAKEVDFLAYFQNYIDGYTKKDIRMMQIALGRFRDFLNATEEYSIYSRGIKPSQLTKDMMIAFTEYLQTRSIGEGAKSIYQRFKKVIRYAIEHDVMVKNPCQGVVIKADDQQLRKDILSPSEIETLAATHYPNENPTIRRAFIFCLYTGLRFCDVKDITFANVDYANRLLKFEQNKTKGHSANSGVVIPLNELHLELIGVPASEKELSSRIFDLPSYEACLKALHRWVKRSGITKHISWHCARHSFATNILANGANIKTVASLLGHSGLKHTEKYTRAVDSLKQDAVNSLPKIDLSK